MRALAILSAAILAIALPAAAQTMKPADQPGASKYAPGQRADEPGEAKKFAPGQQKRDPDTTGSSTFAPGQKMNDAKTPKTDTK